MNIAEARNIGALLKEVLAANLNQIVAGGGKDGVAQNGRGVDREGYQSAKVMIPATAVLAASQTATITAKIQHSSDDGATDAYADYFTPDASLNEVISDGADENGIYGFNVNLTGAEKWIRVVYTVTMSAGSIDTCDVMGVFALAGAAENPVGNS